MLIINGFKSEKNKANECIDSVKLASFRHHAVYVSVIVIFIVVLKLYPS